MGGVGQLGQSLAPALTYMYGQDNVLTTDVMERKAITLELPTAYEKLNAMDLAAYKNIVDSFAPTTILHLPAILSGKIISSRRDGCRNGDSR